LPQKWYSSWPQGAFFCRLRIRGSRANILIYLFQVGYYASKYLTAYGAKLVGVAEWDGSIFEPKGIDPDDLITYKNTKKGIKDYPKASQYFIDEGAIYEKFDIFIPAAFEQTVNIVISLRHSNSLFFLEKC
jgi:Glutamate/Leucine/Phenylalanine/Valine dehydrogenase